MKKRIFPLMVLAGSLFLPLTVFTLKAQSPASGSPRIAIIKSRDLGPYNLAVEGFKEILQNGDFNPDYSSYNLKEEADGAAAKILKRKPVLVLAVGSEASVFCRDNLTGIPAVFSMVLSPPADFEESAMTGVVIRIPAVEQFKQLIDVVGGLETVGILYDADTGADRINEVTAAARAAGLKLIVRPVKTTADIPKALRKVLSEADALWAEASPGIYSSRTAREIILTTIKKKVPFMAFSAGYVRAGALMAMECDYRDIGKQSGEIAARLLRGETPGKIPVVSPRKTSLVINRRTAETIGLKVSSAVYENASQVFGR